MRSSSVRQGCGATKQKPMTPGKWATRVMPMPVPRTQGTPSAIEDGAQLAASVAVHGLTCAALEEYERVRLAHLQAMGCYLGSTDARPRVERGLGVLPMACT